MPPPLLVTLRTTILAHGDAGGRASNPSVAINTRAAKRLSGLGGLLRGLWDGLRKSKVAARIRKTVESEVDDLRQQTSAAAERASAADAGRREAEVRARNLRDSLVDTGRQSADARCQRYAQQSQPRFEAYPPRAGIDGTVPGPRVVKPETAASHSR